MENFIFLSYIPFLIIFIKQENELGMILFCWLFNVFIIKNIKKLYIMEYDLVLTFVRRSLYLLPLVFFFFFFKVSYYFILEKDLLYGIILGVLFLLPNIKNYKFFLSNDYIQYVGKMSSYKIIGNLLSLILGSVLEEIFYKGLIILILRKYIGIYSVLVSSYLFFLHHYLTEKFEKFSKKDYILQIFYGLVTGMIYYKNNNLLLCIIIHLIYNLPSIIFYVKRSKIYDFKLK